MTAMRAPWGGDEGANGQIVPALNERLARDTHRRDSRGDKALAEERVGGLGLLVSQGRGEELRRVDEAIAVGVEGLGEDRLQLGGEARDGKTVGGSGFAHGVRRFGVVCRFEVCVFPILWN